LQSQKVKAKKQIESLTTHQVASWQHFTDVKQADDAALQGMSEEESLPITLVFAHETTEDETITAITQAEQPKEDKNEKEEEVRWVSSASYNLFISHRQGGISRRTRRKRSRRQTKTHIQTSA
jgi:hypothetical protein